MIDFYNHKIDFAELFMFQTGAIITLTRGDSFKAPVFINAGPKLKPQQYILETSDTLYFALMEPNQPFELAILKKVFTNESPTDVYGNTIISLSPEDTEFLHQGMYYYSIKLLRKDENDNDVVNTIVDKTILYIVE